MTWIPVDIAASAIVEMLDAKDVEVVHIEHPNPVKWEDVVQPLTDNLDLPVVSYAEWLSKLYEDDGSVDIKNARSKAEKRPALKLQAFFDSLADGHAQSPDQSPESSEGPLTPRLSLKEACRLSPTLARCPPLSPQECRSWLTGWNVLPRRDSHVSP